MVKNPERWPFSCPRNTAVITLKRIVFDCGPVLMVVCDDEGDYQFLDGLECTEEDSAVVGLETMIKHDPTLVVVACLCPGFGASRESVDEPWHIWIHEPTSGDE